MRVAIASIWIAFVGACGGGVACPSGGCAEVLFDPTLPQSAQDEAASWLAFPFPSDLRRTEAGTIDMHGFPNPGREGTLDSYVDHATDFVDGFGTTAPIYLRMSAAIDLSSLPRDSASFTHDTAVMQLIELDSGARRPLRWDWFDVDGKFVAPRTLAVAPSWGFPMRESTTYALIVTDELRAADGVSFAPSELLLHLLGGPGDTSSVGADLLADLESLYLPLRNRLELEGFDTARVIAATVFTTQSITDELVRVREHLHTLPTPQPDPNAWSQAVPDSFVWNSMGQEVDYWVIEGRFSSPNYTHGTVPYVNERNGGGFDLSDGPQPARFEDLRFVLTVPAEPPRDAACYPIIEYSHGTGGGAGTFAGGQGGRHAARGLATIGIDQPLHGDRWSGSGNSSSLVLYSFNFFNPTSARTVFRQAAVDTFSLTRMLRNGFTIPANASPTGAPICFDPSRIGYFGHSQGGLTGSIAAAVETDIDVWILSGAGGGLSITVFERDDEFIDAQATLAAILEPNEGEVFTEMHPVVGLIQLLSEITDPINYAPHWDGRSGVGAPKHMFVTSGEGDAATPYRTATAMAVAANMPVVAPVVVDASEFELAGLDPVDAPVHSNANDRTFAFMQWADDSSEPDYASHFVVFSRPEAIHAANRFFESWAFDDAPTLFRQPDSTAR